MSSKPAPAPEENEPSMEEILASIRKIIADDSLGTKKDEPAPKKPPAPEPEPEMLEEAVEVMPPPAPDVMLKAEPEPVTFVAPPVEEDDILDLAEVAQIADVSMDETATPADEFAMEEMSMSPAPAPVLVAAPKPVETVDALEDRIISDNTSSLVGQAFAQLSRTAPMPAVGRSLEDVVVEMLRPMLRGWIDEHLPSVVEKLVKAEIERVARGG